MKWFLQLTCFLAVVSLNACVSSSTTTNSMTKGDVSAEPDLVEGSKLNVELGVGYMRRGQYKVAKEKLEKAIGQDPSNIQAYSTLALLLSNLNKKDEAEEYYLEAIDLDENNAWLHNSYGAFLCGIDRLEDAMNEFKLAYEDPFYNTAYLAYSNAGSCLVKSGQYVEAEALIRKALRSDNKLTGALLSMAEIGVKTNKYLMTRAYIQRYHADNRPTAESLWLQVQAEKALNAEEHYVRYAEQLQKNFPDSTEAGMLETLRRDGRLK